MMAVAIPQRAEMPHYNQTEFVLAQSRISLDRPASRLSCERQVLGRRSIEARRLSPVTSSEYMQLGSHYSIKSSIELDPSFSTTRYSQASSMEPLSHQVRYPSPTGHIPSVPVMNNTLIYPSTLKQINQGFPSKQGFQSRQQTIQPVIPARKRSRNLANQTSLNDNGLPPISDDIPCAPMMNSSRFSTSPGRPARSRIIRPPVPRIPELFSSGRPSLDQFRPKKRFATSVAMNESGSSLSDNSNSTPPNDTVTQAQARKGKQSFSSLRKMMGGTVGNQAVRSRLAASSPDSSIDHLQKYSGFAQHHAQRMGARTPPMPVTIEVAPYEYAAEIELSPKTGSFPDHARIQTKEGNHRDTLLIRGSWVDFAKCTEEVDSAKNGKSKTWWSRLLPKKRTGTRRTSLASLSEDKPLECRRVPSPSLPEGRMSLMDFFKEEMERSGARHSQDQQSLPPPLPLPLPPKKRNYNDDSTQKTVGSSILYLDETLNRRTGVQCASPEQITPPTCQNASSVPQTAPLNLNGKQSIPTSSIEFPIDFPTTIAFPCSPVTEDHLFDTSFTSTMDATDVLYDLLSQFKNESSPSTITSNSQTTNRSRPVPSSVMLPEFEMVTPQTLQRSTTTAARTLSITNKSTENRMNRATCTTMETIMSYQSSEDSPLSSLIDVDEVMQASQDFTVEADASGGASAFLNDLIDGIQHDISVSTRSVLNSHTKLSFDSSAPPGCFSHHLKPAASHSTMDSAYSRSAWPLRGNASPFRMMGASVVARELKLSDARRFDDSPCPGSRALKVKRNEEEGEKNLNASYNTDLTVSHVFVPDISLQHSPLPSRPTNPISAQCDTSAGQTPPKIIVDRPQSDSSMSLQSINSPSKCDNAVIQRASVVRKSSASVLDFSSVRMSMDVFGSVVQGKRCRISSMKAKAIVPMLPSPPVDYDVYGSPVSSRSPSQSPNLSYSFAWSGKRFSSSTGYTVPSPIPRSGSGGINSQKSSFGADPFIQSKVENIDESIISDITDLRNFLSLLRESKERFPNSAYSQSLMDMFVAPQTPRQIKQFLHQSRVAFVPLNHEGMPSPDLQVVEIVEGRDPYDGKRWTQKHKIGRTSKRHLMKRMRSNMSGSNNSALSFGDSSFVSQIGKDSEANTSSGDVDMTAFSTTFVDEDSPRCMNDTSDMTSFSSQPQQSSPLARKTSTLSNESSDISEQTLSPDPEEKSVNDAGTNWQPFSQLWSPPQRMIPLSAAMLDAHGQLTRQESIRTRRLSNIKIVIQSPSTRSSVTSPRSC